MSVDCPFERIGIYGVGLMGGSLGLAIKRLGWNCRITGIGRSRARLEEALALGAIDDWNCQPEHISPPLDFLVLCTPVRLLPGHLESALPALADTALVTDVGSTKHHIMQRCQPLMRQGQVFIGSHPMAGSHKTGVHAAHPALYENRVCVITPEENAPQPSIALLTHFWRSVGMHVVTLSPQQHDKLTAFSSHLPHLAAAALCLTAQEPSSEIHHVLGAGFADATRIAAGDPGLWLDICLENRDNILTALNALDAHLQQIKQALHDHDETAIRQFLQHAQTFRNSIKNAQ